MTRLLKTSDMAEELRPVLTELIVKLGYSDEQAETFTNAYLDKVERLPFDGQLRALIYQDTYCMSAGFEAAGINESEAFERYHNLRQQEANV